jgi:hypothetical protein
MDISDAQKIAAKTAFQRFMQLFRSGILLIAVIFSFFAIRGFIGLHDPNSNYYRAKVEVQQQMAEQALDEARNSILDLQQVNSVAETLLLQIDDKTLSDPSQRLLLVEKARSLSEMASHANERVAKTLSTIDDYKAFWVHRKSGMNIFFKSAFADTVTGAPSFSSIEGLKPMIMIGVISAISLFFFICVALFCFTADVDKIKFADNMMRTIVGFYIGIVTGLLGLPGKA